jgi:outer membrane immunogenic protein
MRGLLATTIALAALVSLAVPAHAQQRQTNQQTGQQTANWSGGQVGGFGGVSTLGGNFTEPGAQFCSFGFAATCPEVPFSFSGGSPTVATGGVFAGYSIPWGRAIVGIEADIAAKHGSTSSIQANSHAATGGVTTEAFTGSLSQGWDASIRARVGAPVNYSTLLYATGGVAFGRVSGSFSYSATFASPAPGCIPITAGEPCSPLPAVPPLTGGGAASWSDTRVGYTVGGGAEWLYTRNIKLRVEYRYTDFGSFSKDVPLAVTSGVCAAGCLAAGNAHIDMRAYFHTVRFGIGFSL